VLRVTLACLCSVFVGKIRIVHEGSEVEMV